MAGAGRGKALIAWRGWDVTGRIAALRGARHGARTMTIFIYGTLRYQPLFTLVSGAPWGRAEVAILGDMDLRQSHNGPWPAIVPLQGGYAGGLLLHDLTDDQMARLDAYERPFGYRREDVIVRLAGGVMVETSCYLPPRTEDGSGASWDLQEWIRDASPAALLAAAEVDWAARAAADPETDAAFRNGWGMVRARAAARLRAEGEDMPATIRHRPAAGDFALQPAGPLAGDFFRFAPLAVSHRRFDGGFHRNLPREVMVGSDAALVLPYDPVRDRVLLVEQFRLGPARRGDRNPWVLEPVAGIIDPDEDAETCARREAVEEAGVTLESLEFMCRLYSSPGNATDCFYCYLGVTDLPDDHLRHGGLASEAEDIRLHLVDFSDAMAMLDSGEIAAGPSAVMLLWLDRLRARGDRGWPATGGKE